MSPSKPPDSIPRDHFVGERVSPPLLRERGFVVAITLFWIVVGGVSYVFELMLSFADPDGPMTLGRAATRWVYAVLWWVATIAGIWLADTLTVRSWRHYPLMVFHAVAGASIAVLWSVAAYYINVAIIPGWRPEGVVRMVRTTSMMTWFFYTGLICLVHAVIYAREYRTREINALRAAHLATVAQLQTLKMQLQPHFLFNVLNSISTLMHRDVSAANDMLVIVAEVLRRGFQRVRTQEVTLSEEVRTAELYLQIERIRFQDRLAVEWEIDVGVEGALVPHMILQPVIENAVKHGLEADSNRRRLAIRARRIRDELELEVRDYGPGPSGVGTSSGLGIGLSLTRDRLYHLYGEAGSFRLSDAQGGGGLVRISIPFVHDSTLAQTERQANLADR